MIFFVLVLVDDSGLWIVVEREGSCYEEGRCYCYCNCYCSIGDNKINCIDGLCYYYWVEYMVGMAVADTLSLE